MKTSKIHREAQKEGHRRAEERLKHENDMGICIAQMLDLPTLPNGRFMTTWGNKTPTGLYLTLKRVIEEDKLP